MEIRENTVTVKSQKELDEVINGKYRYLNVMIDFGTGGMSLR